MTHALVLRPEPGNARTCAALAAVGIDPVSVPLFAAVPVGWSPPDPADYDALLLTSAQAVRLAGDGLAQLAGLPVVAVGAATAAAARAAGIDVVMVGNGDAAAAVARAQTFPRLLHLAGREHVAQPGVATLIVYASEALPVASSALAAAVDGVVMLHSARAAQRFALLTATLPRPRISVAALSPAIARAAGPGWARVIVADRPDDHALIEAVAASD
ncbi:uroporphyrinogen-III synthase [Sphingomonas sp. NPDC079357]|jgi:uroporphyrinogen-III synthase|uniref:uroporphyrinogen-III synthase n=1 Tax=Sphingomonas sp. NPDC079357 TaxID=3364518 RepID=UPI00384D41EB